MVRSAARMIASLPRGTMMLGRFLHQRRVKGGEVQMVVVIVADKDHVDRRQVIECDAGRGASSRVRKGQWAGALRPDRFEEDIQAGDLNKETRVTDKRDAALFFLQSCRAGPGRFEAARPAKRWRGSQAADEARRPGRGPRPGCPD
jgi:hypothetical protein